MGAGWVGGVKMGGGGCEVEAVDLDDERDVVGRVDLAAQGRRHTGQSGSAGLQELRVCGFDCRWLTRELGW